MNYYKCGEILTTHGIKGDLKVKPTTDFDRFYKGSRLYIYHNGNYEEVKVAKCSEFGNYYLIAFENMQDINLVMKYHSNEIFVSEEDRGETEDDEYFYSDLIGCKVFNQNGDERGEVIEIRELPQADYLVVRYNEKNHLIPFINEFVTSVEDDKIIIEEIEGLF